MPDHFHLFVATDNEKISLSERMKSSENVFSKALRSSGVDTPHSQKTFFDYLLRSSESHSEKWSYVWENPRRAGLVEKAEGWPFLGEVFRLEYRSG
jgi:hypothetical protein